MRLDKRIDSLPKELVRILKLASEISSSLSYRVYLVGGIVRDFILKRQNLDLDLVVEGDGISFAKKLAEKLGVKVCRHHSFGTATVSSDHFKIDIATAREESYSFWGALPKVRPSSLEKDLFRRDFTINAMAIGLNRDDWGKLLDFYGGYKDLRNGVIRILHPLSFLEDPTRIFRAVRFQVRFSFRIEPTTLRLLKEAVKMNAWSFVHEHRIRDELILIFKEPHPDRYIKKINQLVGLTFLDKKITLTREDFSFLRRIEKAILFYRKNFPSYRKIEDWIIYLGGLVNKLSPKRIEGVCLRFGLKRGERIILLSLVRNKRKMERLAKGSLSPLKIYKLLEPLSFEAILFFYAYYPQRNVRSQIEYFLRKIPSWRLHLRGKDLQVLGVMPSQIYSKILKELLYTKITRNLSTREEELRALEKIVGRLLRLQKLKFKI